MNAVDERAFVLRTVQERGIGFVRLWFTDVLGHPKSFAIPAEELDEALEEGVGFDGSAVAGFARVQESDMLARPDASTFQILPWRPEAPGVARMYCDIYRPDGEAFAGDPRGVLRRVIDRASAMGFSCYAGPELEFFLFEDSTNPTPLDDGSYFDLTPLDVGSDFRRRTITYLERIGIPVKDSHHEVAASQHEVDLRHTDALAMADSIVTFRLVVKEVAQGARRLRDVHAEADPGSVGFGHAHPPLVVRGRPQRVLRSHRRLRHVEDGPGVHRGTPAPRAGDHGDHEPVGELVQAPRARLRGACVRVVGRAEPVGPRPRAAHEAREGDGRARSSIGPPIPRATRTSRSR